MCGEVLKSETEKAAVVGSLNSTQWFEPKRGGWKKTTTLSVGMKSGETFGYSVGLYRSGAVVLGKGDASQYAPGGSFQVWVLAPGGPESMSRRGSLRSASRAVFCCGVGTIREGRQPQARQQLTVEP